MQAVPVCRRVLTAPGTSPMGCMSLGVKGKTGAMHRCSRRHARADPADGLTLIGIACKWWWSGLVMTVAGRE
jgi:hypothetical protein